MVMSVFNCPDARWSKGRKLSLTQVGVLLVQCDVERKRELKA